MLRGFTLRRGHYRETTRLHADAPRTCKVLKQTPIAIGFRTAMPRALVVQPQLEHVNCANLQHREPTHTHTHQEARSQTQSMFTCWTRFLNSVLLMPPPKPAFLPANIFTLTPERPWSGWLLATTPLAVGSSVAAADETVGPHPLGGRPAVLAAEEVGQHAVGEDLPEG